MFETWDLFEQEMALIYRPPQYRPGTWAWHRKTIERLRAICPSPSDLSAGRVAELSRRLIAGGMGDHAVNSVLRSTRKISRDLVRAGVLRSSPFDGSRLMISRPARRRPVEIPTAAAVGDVLALSDLEVEAARDRRLAGDGSRWSRESLAVYRAARLRALAYLLAYVGLRAGEALGLEWSDVDVAGGVVSIRSNDARELKTAASGQSLPLAPAAATVLEEWRRESAEITGSVRRWVFAGWRSDRPWRGGSFGSRPSDEMRALGERAGVPGLTLKAWRHVYASLAKQRFGLTAEQVRLMLRHTTTETQSFYTHEQFEEMRRVANRVAY